MQNHSSILLYTLLFVYLSIVLSIVIFLILFISWRNQTTPVGFHDGPHVRLGHHSTINSCGVLGLEPGETITVRPRPMIARRLSRPCMRSEVVGRRGGVKKLSIMATESHEMCETLVVLCSEKKRCSSLEEPSGKRSCCHCSMNFSSVLLQKRREGGSRERGCSLSLFCFKALLYSSLFCSLSLQLSNIAEGTFKQWPFKVIP